MQQQNKILITGSKGLVGSALSQQLRTAGFTNLLLPTHAELNLINQQQVADFFQQHQPEYVFHLAAIVGGIQANNKYPATFIYDNTQMHCNLIENCHRYGVKKLLFPGSACTYPKLAPQPITETEFLNGFIEPTNIAYAAAKINGLVMCQSFAKQHAMNIVLPMPTNAYGINDHFHPEFSHVIPALLQRFHNAKEENIPEVIMWGSGAPLREFIYADDLADAFIFLMQQHTSLEIINVGTMQEISIIELAHLIASIVGYKGRIILDTEKPDGAPRKCLDSSKLFALGWRPKISLAQGLERVYQNYKLGNSQLARQ